MNTEILEQIRKKVPDFVWNSLNEDYSTNAIIKIKDDYNLEQEDIDSITDIIGLLVLKEIDLGKTKSGIESELRLDDKINREVTLIIFCEILYPIKDYFPGVEDEILKLGGKIPKIRLRKKDTQLLKRTKEMEAMQEAKEQKEKIRMADTIINGTIEELIEKYPKVEEQIIGSQKAIEIEGMPLPMQPLIKYWLRDYQEKMDYVWHSNIDRARYVYQDKNTKNMNEEERRQLNLVLKSLDEKIILPYSTRMKKIDFSKIE